MTISVEFSTKASIGVLIRVPSGYLQLGSRFHFREQPRRTVYVPEFNITQTPVTVVQYAAFLNSGAVKRERWWSREGWAWLQGDLCGWGREKRMQPEAWEIQSQYPYHPIKGITWFEAQAYCAWVSEERKSVVRLPTEAEWEFAARAYDGRPFPWGDYFDSTLANTFEAGKYNTIDVTSTPGDISPFGVMDMAGNVQEWTSSDYDPLSDEIYSDRELKIARGGSFDDTAFGSRTSYRRAYPPAYFYPFLGFRLIVDKR